MEIPNADLPRILIADDQPHVGEALRLLLKGEGFQIELAHSPAAVLEAIGAGSFDLVLLDLNYTRDTTSGREGLELLMELQSRDRALPVVVMTAWGTIEVAVEAMRLGARDFVLKPWENAALLRTLRTQLENGRAMRQSEGQQREQAEELEEAQGIQRGLMPRAIPQIAGCQIAASYRSARALGGDYFDVLKFNARQAGICIADVVGKGMPAALLMSNLQAAVKAFASEVMPPSELCVRVNRILCNNCEPGKYVTFFYALLDAERMRLSYVNAGHNRPVLHRADGTLARLEVGGPVLGEFPEWECELGEIELLTGDRLVLFTDGVTEAADGAGEEFGEQRLAQLLAVKRGLTAEDLQSELVAGVTAFNEGRFRDDATLIVIAVE